MITPPKDTEAFAICVKSIPWNILFARFKVISGVLPEDAFLLAVERNNNVPVSDMLDLYFLSSIGGEEMIEGKKFSDYIITETVLKNLQVEDE